MRQSEDRLVVARIAAAKKAGAEDALIADAGVVDEELQITGCDLRTWRLPFAAHRALRRIPAAARADFEIDEDGSALYWPDADVYLTLDTVRELLDPDARQKALVDARLLDVDYGASIEALRREKGLRQTDVVGVSARQLRRIEGGARPRLGTLRLLAEAHGMTLEAYLDRLAELAGGKRQGGSS